MLVSRSMVAEVKYRDFDLSELNAQLMERYDWIGRRYCLIFAQTSMNELTCKCASSSDRRAVVSRRIIFFSSSCSVGLSRLIVAYSPLQLFNDIYCLDVAVEIGKFMLSFCRRSSRSFVSIPSIAIFRQDRTRSVHEFGI